MSNPILSPGPAPGNGQLLEAALAYSARGWSIIPVIAKVPPPRMGWKQYQTSRPNEQTLRRFFSRESITGLAVITGAVSGGLAVRDYDQADAYDRWASDYPDLAATLPTVRTARGYHVYGRLDTEDYRTLEDGELRADSGHYVLLPPSRHPDGITYTWTVRLPSDGALPLLDPEQAGLLPDTQTLRHPTTQTPSNPDTQIHIACVRQQDGYAIERIIRSTLPNGFGQRNRCLFALAKALKGILPGASRQELREIVQQWHRLALPNIRTQDFTTSWADFTTSWDNVKHPGAGTFEQIIVTAQSMPIPAVALDYDLPAMQALVGLCAALQVHHGPGRQWPLSCRRAGEIIGRSHDIAAKLLKLLVADGVLELMKTAGPKSSGQAAEYRFIDLEQRGNER